MNAVVIPGCSHAPPSGWESACARSSDLFHTGAWQGVLQQGFGCSSLYLWHEDTESGCAVPVFSRGPFRIGYVGFPAGGSIGSLSLAEGVAANLTALSFTPRIDAVRVPISGFGQPVLMKEPAVRVPETAIVELEHWDAGALPSALRRNLKKFSRSDLELKPTTGAESEGERYHRLYLGTIDRYRGRRRYNARYFRALLALSLNCEKLRCTGAYSGDELVAFLVAARSGSTVFYLHGAMDPRFQQARPSDALFLDAIQWAQGAGARQFNMMSSPPSQPGLVRFKEKWGGVTRDHRTVTLAASWLGRLMAPLFSFGAHSRA